MAQLRKDAVKYIEAFDTELWHTDPARTVLNGAEHTDGDVVPTPDAFGVDVGKMVLATPATVDEVIRHVRTRARDQTRADYRGAVRAAEAAMLTTHAAALVGNQALDFRKQDGVTEIEESLEANAVERRLNDLLWADEEAGNVAIDRSPALIGCVSNFSNFLDLCRKCIRNLELGVPVVILSRSNTTQHMYRWARLLQAELAAAGLDDPGMVTYVAATVEEQRRIMAACSSSPLYLTGSREVAAAIKELVPATFASTGGPNTMVASDVDAPGVAEAIRCSVAIENSGQCTAMRHLVAPGATAERVDGIFAAGEIPRIKGSEEALAVGGFAGVFDGWSASHEQPEGYAALPSCPALPIGVRIGEALPPAGVEEHWRRLVLDVTNVASAEELGSAAWLNAVADWLTTEQPITLAVNGDRPEDGYFMASRLFERTAQVVYTVGNEGAPALTCQARPQEGEIFGEFPPRRELSTYTKFPVLVPTPTPGYMAAHTDAALAAAAGRITPGGAAARAAALCATEQGAGYVAVLAEYLATAAAGPRRGTGPPGSRTALWGLQRPPLTGAKCELRLGAGTGRDEFAAHLLPFAATNARDQLRVSVAPGAIDPAELAGLGVEVVEEEEWAFEARVADGGAWTVLRPEPFGGAFPLAGHFVSTIMPLGHIKSTLTADAAFLAHFEQSPKWLRVVADA